MPVDACKDVMEAFERLETAVMLRAQEEGIPPAHAQTILKASVEKDPINRTLIFLNGFGYTRREDERPNLCLGTDCLEQGADYLQLWNGHKDSAFIVKGKRTIAGKIIFIGPEPCVKDLYALNCDLYFAGLEERLDEMNIDYLREDCPKGKEKCSPMFTLYAVRPETVPNSFYKTIGTKAATRCCEIMLEECDRLEGRPQRKG